MFTLFVGDIPPTQKKLGAVYPVQVRGHEGTGLSQHLQKER